MDFPIRHDLTRYDEEFDFVKNGFCSQQWEISVWQKFFKIWSVVLSYLKSAELKFPEQFEERLNKLTNGEADTELSKTAISNYNPFFNIHKCFFDETLYKICVSFRNILNEQRGGRKRKAPPDLQIISSLLQIKILLVNLISNKLRVFSPGSDSDGNAAYITLFYKEHITEGNRVQKRFHFGLDDSLCSKLRKKALEIILETSEFKKEIEEELHPRLDRGEENINLLITILEKDSVCPVSYLYDSSYMAMKLSDAGFETDPSVQDQHGFSAFYYALQSNDNNLVYILYRYAANMCYESENTIRDPNPTIISNFSKLEEILKADCAKSDNFEKCGDRAEQARLNYQNLLRFNEFLTQISDGIHGIRKRPENNPMEKASKRKDVVLLILETYSSERFFFMGQLDDGLAENYKKHKTYYDNLDFIVALLFFDNIFLLKSVLKSPRPLLFSDLESSFLLSAVTNKYITELDFNKLATISLLERLNLRSSVNNFLNILKEKLVESQLVKCKKDKEIDQMLTNFPELRDEFLISRLHRYLKPLETVSEELKQKLAIQRALQVIGEAIKVNEENSGSINFDEAASHSAIDDTEEVYLSVNVEKNDLVLINGKEIGPLTINIKGEGSSSLNVEEVYHSSINLQEVSPLFINAKDTGHPSINVKKEGILSPRVEEVGPSVINAQEEGQPFINVREIGISSINAEGGPPTINVKESPPFLNVAEVAIPSINVKEGPAAINVDGVANAPINHVLRECLSNTVSSASQPDDTVEDLRRARNLLSKLKSFQFHLKFGMEQDNDLFISIQSEIINIKKAFKEAFEIHRVRFEEFLFNRAEENIKQYEGYVQSLAHVQEELLRKSRAQKKNSAEVNFLLLDQKKTNGHDTLIPSIKEFCRRLTVKKDRSRDKQQILKEIPQKVKIHADALKKLEQHIEGEIPVDEEIFDSLILSKKHLLIIKKAYEKYLKEKAELLKYSLLNKIKKTPNPLSILDSIFRKKNVSKSQLRSLHEMIPFSTEAKNAINSLMENSEDPCGDNLANLLNRINYLHQIAINERNDISFLWERAKSLKAKQYLVYKIVQRYFRDPTFQASIEMLLLDCLAILKYQKGKNKDVKNNDEKKVHGKIAEGKVDDEKSMDEKNNGKNIPGKNEKSNQVKNDDEIYHEKTDEKDRNHVKNDEESSHEKYNEESSHEKNDEESSHEKNEESSYEKNDGEKDNEGPFWLKTSYLFNGIDVRNVLAHGDPLLESIGDILDPKDFPSELVTKLLQLLEDRECIEAMCKLREKVEQSDKIPENCPECDELKKRIVSCQRWRRYSKLLREDPVDDQTYICIVSFLEKLV